jgi:vacuolar-type H+-ATPase subunit I/STV1
MPTAKTIAWIERLIWILIYLGLFALVLGLATLSHHVAAASSWLLIVLGGTLAVTGVVLIWVRSRLDSRAEGLSPANAQCKADALEGTE